MPSDIWLIVSQAIKPFGWAGPVVPVKLIPRFLQTKALILILKPPIYLFCSLNFRGHQPCTGIETTKVNTRQLCVETKLLLFEIIIIYDNISIEWLHFNGISLSFHYQLSMCNWLLMAKMCTIFYGELYYFVLKKIQHKKSTDNCAHLFMGLTHFRLQSMDTGQKMILFSGFSHDFF